MKIVVGASAGAASDLYARVVANHLPKQIPGKPEIIVQNMPGGGSLTAANYVYSVAKPDGLTLGAVTAPIYFAQLLGRKEVQFDWAKFTWIGTPEENDELFFIRSDQPYRTLLDLRKGGEAAALRRFGSRQHGILHTQVDRGNLRRQDQCGDRLSGSRRRGLGRGEKRGPLPRHNHQRILSAASREEPGPRMALYDSWCKPAISAIIACPTRRPSGN